MAHHMFRARGVVQKQLQFTHYNFAERSFEEFAATLSRWAEWMTIPWV